MRRIAICGIDGSGKTTLTQALMSIFQEWNISCLYAHVPFDSKQILDAVEINKDFEEFEITKRIGMAFDFVRYYKEVFNNYDIMLCDRYDIDFKVLNDVYHLPNKYIHILNDIYQQVPKADLYIYLKTTVSTAENRLNSRGNRQKDESTEILDSMYRSFENQLQQCDNYIVIDGEESIDTIISDVTKQICIFLKESKND